MIYPIAERVARLARKQWDTGVRNRQIFPKFAPPRVFNRQLVGLEYRQVKLAHLAGM
jgi:hypothetical protein